MRRYLLKKVILIPPSLLALSMIVFFLSRLAPGDPVSNLAEIRGQLSGEFNSSIYSEDYYKIASELKLDLPAFYFSLSPAAYPDTFHQIVHPQQKSKIKKWIREGKSFDQIRAFQISTNKLFLQINSLPASEGNSSAIKSISNDLRQLQNSSDTKEISIHLGKIEKKLKTSSISDEAGIIEDLLKLKKEFSLLNSSQAKIKSVFPIPRFHGLNNQYHFWLKDILSFNFGLSMMDAQKVSKKISGALFWTFLYIITAYIFSLLISIPLGLYSAWKFNRVIEKVISTISFTFYAFPLFWLATLAVVFLTSSYYGDWLNIFPGIGLGAVRASMSNAEKAIIAWPHLILPALIIALHSAAHSIRIVRNSAIVEMKADYFTTARAKGLPAFKVIQKHVFPNAMLPVITMLVSSFPSALAGSVVLEVIFNIPGLGRLLYDSIHFMDWNVVFAILLFIGLLTFVFYLIGDILYAYLNPKIKFD